MSLQVELGLLLSIATALGSVLGFLYKYRGAVESPPVDAHRPIASSLALFRSRWYLLGIAIALGSWGLHVGALALAPISLVQSVIAGGLVLLTVVADRLFGFAVRRREWICVALTAAGLAFLAATLQGTADSAHSAWSVAPLTIYVGLAAGVGLAAAATAARATERGATLLASSAGLIWAASDISIKALSNRLDDGALGVLLHPLAFVILIASLVGLSISARSLQVGDAVPVIAVTSAVANVTTIAAGPLVFGEPFPSDPLGVAARLAAFALVIVAAALIPPPLRAVQTAPPGAAAGQATAAP